LGGGGGNVSAGNAVLVPASSASGGRIYTTNASSSSGGLVPVTLQHTDHGGGGGGARGPRSPPYFSVPLGSLKVQNVVLQGNGLHVTMPGELTSLSSPPLSHRSNPKHFSSYVVTGHETAKIKCELFVYLKLRLNVVLIFIYLFLSILRKS
jgi:hypothetical protein